MTIGNNLPNVVIVNSCTKQWLSTSVLKVGFPLRHHHDLPLCRNLAKYASTLLELSYEFHKTIQGENSYWCVRERVALIIQRRFKLIRQLDESSERSVISNIIEFNHLPNFMPQRLIGKWDRIVFEALKAKICTLRRIVADRLISHVRFWALRKLVARTSFGFVHFPHKNPSVIVEICGNFTSTPWFETLLCEWCPQLNGFIFCIPNCVEVDNLLCYFKIGVENLVSPFYKAVNVLLPVVGNQHCNMIPLRRRERDPFQASLIYTHESSDIKDVSRNIHQLLCNLTHFDKKHSVESTS